MAGVEPVDLHLSDGNDRTCIWETDHIQIMRIRLAVGEVLPHHNANSNVLLLPLMGTIKLVTPEATEVFSVGRSCSVPFDTPMDVSNGGDEPAVLLVVKTPHPRRQ